MKKALVVSAIIIIVFALESCGKTKTEATDSPTQLIAFTSEDEKQQVVYTIKPDGTGLKNVTKGWGKAVDFERWLSDSTGLFIKSVHTGLWNLYLIKLSPHQVIMVTDEPKDILGDISCSPDGKSIFYTTDNGLFEQPIPPVVDARLVEKDAEETPACSPNGKWVSFLKLNPEDSHKRDVWVYSRIDHKSYQLASNSLMVSWLPDDQLIFVTYDNKKEMQLNQIAVPSGQTQVITDGYHPSVSPDGKYVAFLGQADNSILTDIRVMDLVTKTLIYKFNTEGDKWEPRSCPNSISWSPDSRELVFIGEEFDKEDIALRREHFDVLVLGELSESAIIKISLAAKKYSIIYTSPKEPIFNIGWCPK